MGSGRKEGGVSSGRVSGMNHRAVLLLDILTAKQGECVLFSDSFLHQAPHFSSQRNPQNAEKQAGESTIGALCADIHHGQQ